MMKILFLVIAALFVAGCSQDKKEQEHTSQVKVPQTQTVTAEKNVTQETPKVELKETEKVAQKPVAPVKQETVPKEVAVINKTEIDGAKIFVKCSSCHGKNAEKKALGKSHVIKGWKEAKIVDALHGYKAGTYGGSMKAVMKAQVSNLNDAKINAVAKYISEL